MSLWGAAGSPGAMEGEGSERRRSRKRPGLGQPGQSGGAMEGKDKAAPGWGAGLAHLALAARPAGSCGEGSRIRGPWDSGTALSGFRVSGERQRRIEPQWQYESGRCSSTLADVRPAVAARSARSMGAPWDPVACRWLGARGLPRSTSALVAAGLICTVLVAYASWGQLPPLPWTSEAPQLPWTSKAPPLPWTSDAPPRPVGVLLWWEPFTGRSRDTRPPPDCWMRFNISGCRLLTNRTTFGEAQAVLFHHRDLVKKPLDWPPPWGVRVRSAEELELQVLDREISKVLTASGPRPPGQRWVWMNFESPSHSPGLRSLAGNLFNWTLSYRADSDIFVPYGYLYPRTNPSDEPQGLVPPLARKRGLVAWVVSNWDESQARVRYYHQLRQHVSVDVFGKGGTRRPVPDIGILHTVARYKFYLAFENSQHQDYITEKLWRNALLAGTVPVVLGPNRANYERFVPRGAFIHVDDFPNASSLAAYLLFLDRNPAVYSRYFTWRRSYAVHITSFWDEPWCRACQAVQRALDQPQSIGNLARWFEQ